MHSCLYNPIQKEEKKQEKGREKETLMFYLVCKALLMTA